MNHAASMHARNRVAQFAHKRRGQFAGEIARHAGTRSILDHQRESVDLAQQRGDRRRTLEEPVRPGLAARDEAAVGPSDERAPRLVVLDDNATSVAAFNQQHVGVCPIAAIQRFDRAHR